MSDPETSQSQLAPPILNQSDILSGVGTAATSVQTFTQDEEKKESGNEDTLSTPQVVTSTTEDVPKLMEESSSSNTPAESTERAVPAPMPMPQTPQTPLTFLLVSGKRRTMSFEPETTIGRVKELVWNAWPNEWQGERPPGPSYLRILYLGKILQDEDTLTKLSFPSTIPTTPPSVPPTIVHLSIRPYAPPSADDDDQLKKKKSRRTRVTPSTGVGAENGATGPGDSNDGADAGRCCGCIIC